MPPRAEYINPLTRSLQRVGAWLRQHPELADGVMFLAEQLATPTGDLHAGEKIVRAVLPPNWWQLTAAERQQAMSLVGSSAVCLIWVPRADVVRRLLATEDKAARDTALLAARAQILDDVEAILKQAHDPKLGAPIAAAREAVAAERAGMHHAAQALCGSIVSDVLAKHYGAPKFADARRRLEQQSLTMGSVRFWRCASVQSALLAAIAQTWVEPPPEGFNRHLTAHGVDSAQFTPAHALEALLLVGAILREVHEIYAAAGGGARRPLGAS